MCRTLCNPMNCSPPCSSIHGIFQARILEWIAIFFSRGSSQPRDWTQVSHTAGRLFTILATRESLALFLLFYFKSWKDRMHAQLYMTLHNPIDCSLPGSSALEIFQARILEWVAISFSRRSFQPRDWTQVSHIVGRCFTIWATRETKRKLHQFKLLPELKTIPISLNLHQL